MTCLMPLSPKHNWTSDPHLPSGVFRPFNRSVPVRKERNVTRSSMTPWALAVFKAFRNFPAPQHIDSGRKSITLSLLRKAKRRTAKARSEPRMVPIVFSAHLRAQT